MLVSFLNLSYNIDAQSVDVKIPEDPVKIGSGLISRRLLADEVKAYLAILYATSPVGELRWREP